MSFFARAEGIPWACQMEYPFAEEAGRMEVFLSNHANGHAHSHSLQVLIVDAQDVFRRKIRDILHGIGGFQVVAETTS